MRTKQHTQKCGQKQGWHRVRHGLLFITAWAIVSAPLVFANTSGEEVGQGTLLNLVALESYRYEKQLCQEKFPEFNDRNEVAFRKAPYSQMTGEELITSQTAGDARQKLLAYLPEIRADIRERYTGLTPQRLKSMCSTYANDIEQQTPQEADIGHR